MRWGLFVLGCSACGRIGFAPQADAGDAGPDAPFPTGPFGTPVSVDVLNTAVEEDDVSLTADMLEIYFGSARGPTQAVWRSTRSRIEDPWSSPVEVVELGLVNNPRISADGLTMYCASARTGSVGSDDIWYATRPDRGASFSALQNMPGNTVDTEIEPWLDVDALVMYLTHLPATGTNGIARRERASTTQPFGPSEFIATLSAPGYDGGTWVREDELLLYFHSDRTSGNREIYMSTRTSTGEPWGAPVLATELNSPVADSDVWLSPDGHTIYFVSRRVNGVDDIFMATR